MEQRQDSSESTLLFENSRRIETGISRTNFDSIECGLGTKYKLHFMRWL